jgi:hypothetical protein
MAFRHRHWLREPAFSPLRRINTDIPDMQDRGVSAVFPLDWHYARKSGFDKYN